MEWRTPPGCGQRTAGQLRVWDASASRVGVVMVFFFFFQAEDGIRDIGVTGVQTCALPIFFLTIVVALGFVFQIPAMIFVLSRIGLVSAGSLARNLKYAIFGSTVIAAVV